MRNRVPKYTVPINGRWQEFTDKAIEDLPKGQREIVDKYIYEYQQNPLAFSLLHGRTNEKWGNDGLAFVNNYEDDLLLLTAGNQSGKSFAGCIFTALRIIPCDPEWTCFKQHGLVCPEWSGPKIAVCASYTWDLVNVLWQTYQKILPRHELGAFSPAYGIFDNEQGRPKNMTFNNYRAKQLRLTCGSQIVFLCYKQSLAQWESRQCDIAHLDEQAPEDMYDALSQRQVTRGSYTPIIMTLTGHIIPDRPDTGAEGWIKRKVIERGVTKGRKLAQYKIAIEDVPDAILSQSKKANLKVQWVDEPTAMNDEKKLREAEARYWGGWEVGGGAVLSEFNPEIHVIPPFDYKKYKPTYYRMIDHGQDPCAAGIIAVLPWGDAVLIKEYYEYGRSLAQNAEGIVAMCGNIRRKVDEYQDMGQTWPIYDEVFIEVEPASSELDIRSYGKNSELLRGRNLGSLYNQFGLQCTRANGQHNNVTIPLLKQWLALDKAGTHIVDRLKMEKHGCVTKFGAPKLYIFSTCENTINEILGWVGEDKADHMVSVLKFMFSRDRPYQGDYYIKDKAEPQRTVCEYTGY